MTKHNYTISAGLKEYLVEYLHVTAKGHSFKECRVLAGCKGEALAKCPKMTVTGRVKEMGEVFSNLREVIAVETLKSDRGCRVW